MPGTSLEILVSLRQVFSSQVLLKMTKNRLIQVKLLFMLLTRPYVHPPVVKTSVDEPVNETEKLLQLLCTKW